MSTLISLAIDEESSLKGYLAIDSTVNGCCCGGLRIAADLSPTTLAETARVMTLKYGFLGLPVGGAKAGIVADPEMPIEKKRELLKSFGLALRPLLQTKNYIPAGDLGTTDDDIRFMFTDNGLKVPPRSLPFQLSGFYTGLTVFTAALIAAQHIGLDPSNPSIAIEGFGNVGSSVAEAFWKKGMRVVAISTSQGAIYAKNGLDIGKLIKLRSQVGSGLVKFYPGAKQIHKEELLELEVDLLCPCANSYSITADNAGRVSARIISPGANAPTTAEAEQILFEKGVLSIPDFVANCGGVLGASMKRTGLKDDFIRHFIDQKFRQRVAELIQAAEKKGVMPREYAQEIAEKRFMKAKERAEKKNFTSRAFNFTLELYRKGIIPHHFVTPFAPRYFERRLADR